ncbi:Na/Pi cotransporter family protein [Thermodesulfobacteriota bacterium]
MKSIDSRRTLLLGFLGLFFIMLLLPLPAQAGAASESKEINWFFLVVGLLGGLSLFLYGMEKMSDALKNVAGEKMKDILAVLSNNRIMGLITGAIVTAVIQSSSVTTVMLVGFVTAGLMSLSQTVGVMKDAMEPLKTYQPFINLMANMSNPVLGILVAAFFTALVQSSSASMGVVIVLAMQGLITLEAGISLALGANIGTCVTAGLASLGKPREAVRVAVCHVLFKIIGVLIMLPLIGPFAKFVVYISPSPAEGLTGLQAAASVLPRQVANAHTLFNIGIGVLFLPSAPGHCKLSHPARRCLHRVQWNPIVLLPA